MRKYVDGGTRFVLKLKKFCFWHRFVDCIPCHQLICPFETLKTYFKTGQSTFQERESCIFKLFVTKHWDCQWVFTLRGPQDLEMDDVIGCSVPSSHWVDCHTTVLSWVGQTSVVYQHAAISKGLEPPCKDKPNISLSKFLYQQYWSYYK